MSDSSGVYTMVRPEGPEVNSHVRKSVGEVWRTTVRREGPTLFRTFGAQKYFRTLIHALTGVAINFRPFGPE